MSDRRLARVVSRGSQSPRSGRAGATVGTAAAGLGIDRSRFGQR